MQRNILISLLCFSIVLCETLQIMAAENPISGERQFTFELDPGVSREQVKFRNRFGIELCADVYKPTGSAEGTLPAIVVGGSYAAVKEQASGLYANKLAYRGFLTLAFDPSYTGESGGNPGICLRQI